MKGRQREPRRPLIGASGSLVAALACTSPATAQDGAPVTPFYSSVRAGTLLEWCDSDDVGPRAACAAYVLGAIDGNNAAAPSPDTQICLPPDRDQDALIGTVVAALKEVQGDATNAGLLEAPAVAAVASVAQTAFPCGPEGAGRISGPSLVDQAKPIMVKISVR